MNNETNVTPQHSVKLDAGKVRVIKLGIDLHAATAMVVAQLDDAVPKPAQRIPTENTLAWVGALKARHPFAAVHACYEAGPCGYWLQRELTRLGVSCHVVAPVALNGRRKTDKRDARALCDQLDRFVRGNPQAFSKVHVPTAQQEDERALLRHRRGLVGEITRCSAKGRSAFLRLGLRVRGSWWMAARWSVLSEKLPAHTRFALGQLRAQLELLRAQLREADKQVSALAERRKISAPRGVGALTWLTLMLEVVDWTRFKNRRQVASYTGLCPGEHTSGDNRQELSIDKHGNPRVRHLLIEAAWRMLRWQPQYPPIRKLVEANGSRSRRRLIVAAARKLAIDVWRIATGQTTPEKVGLNATDTVLAAA
jgi:transposase